MKYILYLLIIFQPIISTGQNWLWAKHAGSSSIDNVNNIITDNNGDVYIFGKFGVYNPSASVIDFDTVTISNLGVNQLFLVKYSGSGNVVWVKGIGGYNPSNNSNCSECESAYDMIFDSLNSVLYITGKLYGAGDFGGTILTGNGTMFLSKLDINGNYIWTKLIGVNTKIGAGLSLDKKSKLYLNGYTPDTALVNGFSILPGHFWAQMDTSGNILWQKTISNKAISGKLYFNNNFIYSLFSTTNDTSIIDTLVFISDFSINLLFAKFDSMGNLLSYTPFTGKFSAYPPANMKMSDSGYFYISSSFDSIANIDTLQLSSPGWDFIICKLNPDGELIWIKNGGSQSGAYLSCMAISNDDKIYIVGHFSGVLNLGAFSLNSSINYETFMTQLNGNGSYIYATKFAETKFELITSDALGNSYITGGFPNNVTIGSNSFSSVGADDIFLAKHDVITGIEEVTKKSGNQLIIYANPNQGKCNITIPDDFLNEKYLLLSIYDITGKLIQQKQLEMTEGNVKLDLQAEAKGIYNVTLSNKIKSYSGKIIFE